MDKKIQELYNQKNNKLRWDLVPWNAFEKVVEVITEGAKEENYGIDNWKTQPSNIFDAAMIRHYISYKKGERYDKRWNLTHLAHLACNAIFLLWKELLVINIEKKLILELDCGICEYEKLDSNELPCINCLLYKDLKQKGELKSNEAL